MRDDQGIVRCPRPRPMGWVGRFGLWCGVTLLILEAVRHGIGSFDGVLAAYPLTFFARLGMARDPDGISAWFGAGLHVLAYGLILSIPRLRAWRLLLVLTGALVVGHALLSTGLVWFLSSL